jgi:hypothetical protein
MDQLLGDAPGVGGGVQPQQRSRRLEDGARHELRVRRCVYDLSQTVACLVRSSLPANRHDGNAIPGRRATSPAVDAGGPGG